jgi:hypothetical protein
MAPFDARGLARMLGQLGDVPTRITRTERVRFLRGFALAAGRALPPEVLARALRLTESRVRRRAQSGTRAALTGSAAERRASI